MLDLNVNAKSPSAINAAVKKIKEMVKTGAISKDSPIHLVLEAGVYHETVKYNLSNPLVIESAARVKPEDCVVQADNCEAFNKGIENRGVFILGPNVTNVSLKKFSIINTHNKSSVAEVSPADIAEALTFNNSTGTLFAENMIIEGKQNTLFIKGFSWFLNCTVSGDSEFIYGEVDTAVFENCHIHLKEDTRGDFAGFAVKSSALNSKPGLIFSCCTFSADKRKKVPVFVYKTEGKGTLESPKDWDSVAFITCMFSEFYDEQLVWDDDMVLNVFPRGNAKTGVREYNSKVVQKNGNVVESETSLRNVKTYTLTQEDYFASYSSRYLLLKDTPFGIKE